VGKGTYGRRPLLVVSLALRGTEGLRRVLGRALGVVALVRHLSASVVAMGESEGVWALDRGLRLRVGEFERVDEDEDEC